MGGRVPARVQKTNKEGVSKAQRGRRAGGRGRGTKNGIFWDKALTMTETDNAVI